MTAPEKRVTVEEAVMSGKGAPALLTFWARGIQTGELIAATEESVWILTDDESILAVYPTSALRSVTLGVHDNDGQRYGIWTAIGAVSTIGHGTVLLGTLPLWLLVGSAGSTSSPGSRFISVGVATIRSAAAATAKISDVSLHSAGRATSMTRSSRERRRWQRVILPACT